MSQLKLKETTGILGDLTGFKNNSNFSTTLKCSDIILKIKISAQLLIETDPGYTYILFLAETDKGEGIVGIIPTYTKSDQATIITSEPTLPLDYQWKPQETLWNIFFSPDFIGLVKNEEKFLLSHKKNMTFDGLEKWVRVVDDRPEEVIDGDKNAVFFTQHFKVQCGSAEMYIGESYKRAAILIRDDKEYILRLALGTESLNK
ncbi:MAG: hypothetical protein ACK4NC_07055 [Candidatus Gracilibacteria bacterium]